MQKPDFLIVGGGIFGLSTALHLLEQKHGVALVNPDTIPHPQASSTDISKIVRMEYGKDSLYFAMAEASISGWKVWNEMLGEKIYHEVGFFLASRQPLEADSFEGASYRQLLAHGYAPRRLDSQEITARFAPFRSGAYAEGFFNPHAGFAESGRTLELLLNHFRRAGGVCILGEKVTEVVVEKGQAMGVRTGSGRVYQAGQVIVCAGAHTPYLLPELLSYFRVTGHPVFHLRPRQPERFEAPQFSVFAADIANTGWYGFPLHPRNRVVKIANHGRGLPIHPEQDARQVNPLDHSNLREFLQHALPELLDAEVTYTRRCLYSDTLDGHFWIDRHPAIRNLTVGSGGSGHGFKMGPVLGKLIAAAALGEDHPWLPRFRWRELTPGTLPAEEARNS